MKKKPNIVLITCDQMRGDCLGIAGHPDVKTPYLDQLAAKGTFFPNAYTATPSCIAARTALITGLSQKKHGRVGYRDGVEWTYDKTFPQVLGEQGYHTAAIGKMHVHPPRRRCGFDQVTLHDGYIHHYRNQQTPHHMHQEASDDYLRWLKNEKGYAADVIDTGIECNSWLARPWIYDEMSHPTNWVISQSIDFLKTRDKEEPFFLMPSFVRPHPPWDAPQAYFDMYRDVELREPAMGDWINKDELRSKRRSINAEYTTRDKELQRQGLIGYYACITHMDHQIGRLLEALNAENILDDTVIIFTSDHGELLFDHGMFRKVQPYQGSVQVPMLINWGRNVAPNLVKEDVCDAVMELRDIGPTILDFAGIQIPQEMDGLSLLPSMSSKDVVHREYLHGEHSMGVRQGEGAISNHYIVTKTDKFIWFSTTGREQYFDLQADPREERDLIADPKQQERIATLRNSLIAELQDREEGYSDGKSLIKGRSTQAVLSFLRKE